MEQIPEHPNVVTFKENFEYEKCFQVVMTICDGGGLFSRKGKGEGGRFTERQEARAIRNIMEGVKFCHQKYIFHGDIKPGNIMWKDKEKSCLFLVDFGVSLKFTPVIDKSYGKEADIWSVGVILYQMINSTLPFGFHHDGELFN
ncbi:putative protein kinase CAMK-CDPK family [Helianthus annuus]|nr:putative protein kinase CAMK-CDPK family [Helianthus annuus]